MIYGLSEIKWLKVTLCYLDVFNIMKLLEQTFSEISSIILANTQILLFNLVKLL